MQCLCPAVSLERSSDHEEALGKIEQGYDLTKMLFLVINLASDAPRLLQLSLLGFFALANRICLP